MKYQIKRKYENGQNWYYPMHSRFGLIYSYFITYRVISLCSGTSDIPLKEKVKFDDLEDAKAFIVEKILEEDYLKKNGNKEE